MKTYTPSEKDSNQIKKNFVFIPKAKPDQVERYQEVREKARGLAEFFVTVCPSSRELSLALTYLEDAVMWANNAIARNEDQEAV
jgi:hypothetical protein